MKKKFILVFLFALVVCSCENVTKGLFSGVILPTAETIPIGGGVYKVPDNFKNNLNNPDGISVWTTRSNATQSDELGKKYSGVLGLRPYLEGYATVGNENLGSYRIPSITKTKLPDGKTRLICAFDVRYRGRHNGGGDVGASGDAGSDITVMYSDDEGSTWTVAINKKTGKKPAIDVDNTYDGDGVTKSHTKENTLDVCDPQLTVMPDGTIYCGMAAGGGNLQTDYSNFRLWKSTDNGETWEEDEHSSASNVRTDTFFHKWMKNIAASGQFKTGITTPGHGIVLGKDVPNSPLFKKGQVVMPIFLNGTPSGTNYPHIQNKGGMYLATGLAADPFDWDTSNFYKTYTKWDNNHQEESQVCQLDDGSILMYGKNSSTDQFSRYRDGKWTILPTSNISNGQNCQSGLLKVADGDGTSKYGVVAFSYSGNAAKNASNLQQGAGRGNITICLARDISAKSGTGPSDVPLDETEPYYLKIRTKSQSYFGYTDMVMITDTILGIIYETYDAEQNINGMRFLRIDIGAIIKELSEV